MDDSTYTQVSESLGLQKFLSRTYKTTFFSICGSLTLAKLFGTAAIFNPMGFAVGGFVVSLAGVVGVNKFAYEHVVEKVGKYEVYKT
jgi:FtsH-binding integral membrane protein